MRSKSNKINTPTNTKPESIFSTRYHGLFYFLSFSPSPFSHNPHSPPNSNMCLFITNTKTPPTTSQNTNTNTSTQACISAQRHTNHLTNHRLAPTERYHGPRHRQRTLLAPLQKTPKPKLNLQPTLLFSYTPSPHCTHFPLSNSCYIIFF